MTDASKKILTMILAGIILFSNIGTILGNSCVVYAEKIPEEIVTDYHINPLYADVIDKENLQQGSSEHSVSTFAMPHYVSDINVIVSAIRSAMVAREESITLYYTQKAALGEGFLGEWIDLAVEETGKPNEGDYLKWHYGGASAEANGIYYPATGIRNYTVDINFTYYTTAEQEEEFDAVVVSLIKDLGISEELSDYKKVKIIYDYICDNVTYDYKNLNDESYTLKYSAYAALLNKTAVCQGYATLFYRLLREVGVDNRVVTGIGNGGPHAWNLVNIGEKYYLADATWDAGETEYDYFLKGTTDFFGHEAESDFLSSYAISDTEYKIGFTDVNDSDWFYDAVCYTYETGMMTGKSEAMFAPNIKLSRAEFASVLYCANDLPEVEYKAVFPDIAEYDWFADAVIWASKEGIVNGYGSGLFGPGDAVAREQMAIMMYNYAAAKGYATDQRGDLGAFKDAGDVSWYAKEALQWAVGAGVITGKDGGTRLDPYGATSRAECAAIMQKFMNNCAN